MSLVQVATEQTTACTDLILGILSLAFCYFLKRAVIIDRFKQTIWLLFFLFLGLASLLGAIVHGIEMSPVIASILWYPLYLFLVLSVAFFVSGSVYELWGESGTRRFLPWILSLAFLSFCLTVLIPGYFVIFLIYEGLCLAICLSIFLFRLVLSRQRRCLLMVLGILITILAAILQSMSDISLYFIWEFDHNGIFHLVQIFGLVLIFVSARQLLQTEGN